MFITNIKFNKVCGNWWINYEFIIMAGVYIGLSTCQIPYYKDYFKISNTMTLNYYIQHKGWSAMSPIRLGKTTLDVWAL